MVYNTHQQRTQYIVEFTLPGETPLEGNKGEDVGEDESLGEKPVDEGKRRLSIGQQFQNFI